MALLATNRFAGDGSTTSYEFNFVGKYIARAHVKAYQEDGATKVRSYLSITDSNFLNDTTLQGLPATPVGSTLVIYRETPKPPMVDFVNGSRFTEYNMDLVARQGLFVAMEAMDAGDSDARQDLLDAIAVVGGLVDDATAAVSDATAAALAAATSAATASDAATTATSAKTAAEAANTAAQGAKTGALASASAAAASATSAGTSATNAANSASTASTQAGLAGGYAVSANTQANNAANSATAAAGSATAASGSATAAATSATNANTSATNAANSASAAATSAASAAAPALTALGNAGPMQCRVVVVDAASRIVRLERCGGNLMTINGQVRTIPAAGIQLTLAASATPTYVYAGWDGSNIAVIENVTNPTFDSTLGQWIYPGNANYIPVAFVRPNALTTPERFLRNYYNGHGMSTFTGSLTSDFTANWDALERQLITMPILLMPGDSIDIRGQASIMSTPTSRVGDLIVKLGSGTLARSRNTHAGATLMWHTYCTSSGIIQRGSSVADPAQQAIFEMFYFPISNTGSTWVALGDGASTRIIVSITPYKWA